MASPTGTPVYNPVDNIPSIVDTNELSYATTTLNGAVSASATTLVLTSAVGFAVGQYIYVDTVGALAEVVIVTAIASNTLTIYPSLGKSHASGIPVLCKIERPVNSIGSPTVAGNVAEVDTGSNLKVASTKVGAGSFATGQVTLTVTSAALIVAARAGVAGIGRTFVTVVNEGSVPLAIGPSGVIYTTGMILPAGGSANIPTTAAIYGCLQTSGSAVVSYYEVY